VCSCEEMKTQKRSMRRWFDIVFEKGISPLII
jgi:hypothetical protein